MSAVSTTAHHTVALVTIAGALASAAWSWHQRGQYRALLVAALLVLLVVLVLALARPFRGFL